METTSHFVCSADVAAFVDALETINSTENEVSISTTEHIVNQSENLPSGNAINQESIIEQSEQTIILTKKFLFDNLDEPCGSSNTIRYFNQESRKQKSIMQHLLATNKACIIKKPYKNLKGTKHFKSDVWNWFGDVQLLISEEDANELKLNYYVKTGSEEKMMISKSFVGCFKCSSLFMYDCQKHSTSTLRYHIRACTRPKECIFISEDKLEENGEMSQENDSSTSQLKKKRVRTNPRRQKEVIEQLFQKQKALVIKKSFMNMKGNRCYKSDVWNWFGDVKLLVSRSEAKKLKIPYYIRRYGDEEMILSKVFVGCFKCFALFIYDSQKSTSTLRYHIRTCSRPRERKKRNKPNIVFLPNNKKPQNTSISDSEIAIVQEKMVNFSLSTKSNFDVLKNKSLLNILRMCVEIGAIFGDVNVESLLCASSKLSSFSLNDMYMNSINEFYTEFQHSYGVTYGLNVWIDEQAKIPFISVISTYINPSGEKKSVTIHTDEFDYETKSATDGKNWFSSFLTDQPIIPHKRLFIVDNKSNLLQIFADEKCIRCVVQNLDDILQSLINEGIKLTESQLPELTNFLSNCISIVEYFEQISDKYHLPDKLVKCPDDRWYSVITLFYSIINQYDEIVYILNQTGDTHLLTIDKEILFVIIDFFKYFQDAISELSDNSMPTLNRVLPWIASLQKHCVVERSDANVLIEIKTHVALQIEEIMIKNLTIYHYLATILDPNFKSIIFFTKEEYDNACFQLKCLVKECMELPKVEDYLENKKLKAKINSHNEITVSETINKCDNAARHEVESYLSEPFPNETQYFMNDEGKFSLLQYWNQNNSKYSHLSKIARWILSCPSSCFKLNENFHYSNDWLISNSRMPFPSADINKILFVKSFQKI